VDGGRYGKGVRFDGDGDAVVIPDDPSLEPGAGDFTIEAWTSVKERACHPVHTAGVL
jgi:hypothetical protein